MTRPTQYAAWTNRKMARLRECYRAMSWDDLAKEFAPHPLRSIQAMAHQMGLKRRSGQRDWLAICAQHRPVVFSAPITLRGRT
jgi:hypothetical protein